MQVQTKFKEQKTGRKEAEAEEEEEEENSAQFLSNDWLIKFSK